MFRSSGSCREEPGRQQFSDLTLFPVFFITSCADLAWRAFEGSQVCSRLLVAVAADRREIATDPILPVASRYFRPR